MDKPDLEKNMKEKKEEFLNGNSKTKKKKDSNSVPMYLMAMLLVLGLLGGYAISIFLTPSVPIPDDTPDDITNDISYRTVPITMLYSDDCKVCRKTNTIEELFQVRQIPYTLQQVEVSSEEGKIILARFDIDTVPTAIIDAGKINFYPSTKENFDNVFFKQNNAYIAPELNLNENKYYPYYFLNKIEGFCNSEKPSVIQFDDFYADDFSRGRLSFYDFLSDYNESIDLQYSYTQTRSSQDNNAIIGNLFLNCASQQDKYIELEREMTGIYCNNPFKGDETILTGVEIAGCWTISQHYGIPLSQIELDVALARTTIDINSFLGCIENKEALLNNSEKFAEEVGITRPGTFLLDCRETISLVNLEESFCEKHPEICVE